MPQPEPIDPASPIDPGEVHVVGIGNALVDVLANASDEFVAEQGLPKGSMTLVDEPRAHELYDTMGPGIEISGGSAANTVVGVASFGSRAAYVGKVRDDQLGEVFGHDIRATGVRFDVTPAADGPSTGRCLVLVTPDAQRTMNTFLGASVNLCPDDLDGDLIARARVLYLEGYLFDPPHAQEAFREAARLAHDAGRAVSLTLSDSFCVDRHRDAFLQLVDHHIDLLFSNEAEICSLYECPDVDTAVAAVRRTCDLAVVTRSEKGSIVVTPDEVIEIPVHPVEHLVDTTGAGDLYAAGFLHGFANRQPLELCGHLGSLAAAEVISHIGARPAQPLAELARPLLGVG